MLPKRHESEVGRVGYMCPWMVHQKRHSPSYNRMLISNNELEEILAFLHIYFKNGDENSQFLLFMLQSKC